MHASGNLPLFLAIGAAITLAGCSGGTPDKGQSGNMAQANATPASGNVAVASSTPPAPGPQAISSKADGLEFSYKWPAAASAIPALNDWLRGNGEKLRAENQSAAGDAQAEAKKDGFPFNGYSYEEDYATVADTPRMLVLLSSGYIFTGGAHGMPVSTAILWDKTTQKRLATGAMIDLPRFAALTKKRFCEALDKQRAEKRGEPVRHDDPNELDEFDQCIDMTKQLVLPISRGGKALDTVHVLIGPYEAGPYAEGSYEIDLPLDGALLATVKPAYRDAFAAGR